MDRSPVVTGAGPLIGIVLWMFGRVAARQASPRETRRVASLLRAPMLVLGMLSRKPAPDSLRQTVLRLSGPGQRHKDSVIEPSMKQIVASTLPPGRMGET